MLMPLFPDNSLVIEVEKFKMENELNSEVKNEMFHILNCGFEIKQGISYITSHPFFTGSLELTNYQLPTSVTS